MEILVCKDCGNKVIYDKPKKYKKIVLGKEYTLQVCQKCLLKRFPSIKNLSRIFNTNNEVTCYAFNIPIEEAKKSNKKYSWTKEKAIEKYGEEKGLEIWNNYCEKQSQTNTFEYKKEKYGWTKEQFDEYNQSRAVTLENLIKRHGKEKGLEIWNNYIIRQSETKSFNWMVEKYGEEKAIEINSQKSLTLENFIRKYGEEEGALRWEEFSIKRYNPYSQISQILFEMLDKYLSKKYTTYYATKNNGEWFVRGNDQVYYLDYFIKELNICIEFNGNAWHGNPKMFKPTDHCHPIYKDMTAFDLQLKDKKRIKELKNKGIKTYIIWESDFDPKCFDVIDYINNILKIEL
jgi:hypothetical protein